MGSIYHAGLYLGRGWFIHSTGSSDGVTLASLNNSSYWKAAFAWGRRVLTPAELVVTTPSPSPSPTSSQASAARASEAPVPSPAGFRRPGVRLARPGRCPDAPASLVTP